MKYTSLFSAVAIAAAMGTQALATVTTNDVGTVQDFEGADPIASRTGWTVQTEDQSEIIAAPLSSADAVAGYTANQHLKLNTEGQELVWRPGTVSEPKSIIEMKVRLVASDTEPAISSEDSTVHAAVYLKVSETPDPTNDGLYAYTDNGWSKLDAAFNSQLATGSMIALRVLMDYEARTATYEGCLLADAENDVPVFVNLGTKNMANRSNAENQGHLATIGFKGTGGVDDLFVKEIEETPSTATINFEYWEEGEEDPAYTDSNYTLDTVDPNSVVTSAYRFNAALVVKKVELFQNGSQLTWTEAPAFNGNSNIANISVSTNNYTFLPDTTYLVKVTAGEPAPTTYEVTFVSEGSTFATTNVVAGTSIVAPDPAPTKAADAEYTYEFEGWYTDAQFSTKYTFGNAVNSAFSLYANFTSNAIPAVTGVEFGTFAIVDGTAQFTAFSVSGSTATATLSANIESTGTQTQKTLYAKYETALGSGTYGYAEATVTDQTAGKPGSVTFTFTVPAGNALFLRGLSNENGSN